MGVIMKRAITVFFCLVIVFSLPFAMVCANSQTVSGSVTRGAASLYVSSTPVLKTSDDGDAWGVNLLGFSAPGIPTNIVASNDLVFRPYTSGGYKAADTVNFRNTYCDGNNTKFYSYYSGKGAKDHVFYMCRSLNSSSVSPNAYYTIRWNP
jgi:hypothetical protein